MIDTFEAVNGMHPGFRRNHAKGVCIAGIFEGNGQGERLSTAAVWQAGRVPVVGRLALAGGQPFMADGPKAVRSMALSFRPPRGEEWRTGMNDIPVFVLRDAQGFYEQLVATRPDPATGQPDPAKGGAFFAAPPESAPAGLQSNANPFSTRSDNSSYNILNA